MAEVNLAQELEVNSDYVLIKFSKTLLVSTIDDEDFIVTKVSPETVVDNPFETIDISEHYNSISRTLTLYWTIGKLEASTNYTLTITGLEDVAGNLIPEAVYEFISPSAIVDDADTPPTPIEFSIVDKSINKDAFIPSNIITGTNTEFYIDSIDPEDGSYYLEEDYNNGRITVKFSNRVDNELVTYPYFKAQRKLVQRTPTRWEKLDALIYQDGNRPWVYIDLPSIDHWPEAATPSTVAVYGEEGYQYLEEGYKYRIIISGDVST